MPGRFLAIVGSQQPLDEAWLASLQSRAETERGLTLAFDVVGRLSVLTDGTLPFLPIEGGLGIALGHLFSRDDGDAPRDIGKGSKVGFRSLDAIIQDGWGGYVAFCVRSAPAYVEILRDPSGGLACYYSARAGVTFFYSDISDAVSLGLVKARPDPGFAAHYLTYSALRITRTGLFDVRELLPGQRLSLYAQRCEEACNWTPWRFAARDQQIEDRDEAIARVRHETQRCVTAWASQSRSILLELSGGLDSSIVAACLQHQSADVRAFCFATPDAAGDERPYARAIAARTGISLETIELVIDEADICCPLQHLSPRPGAGVLQQVIDMAVSNYAVSVGVDGFFGGGGGDNVFCFLGTAAPAADVLRRQGFSPEFWRTINNLSVLHTCTHWTAFRLAVKKALRGSQPWKQNASFLAPDVLPLAPDPHPWWTPPPDALPGKREHVASLMRMQGATDGKARVGLAPVRYPLLSQPLVELCLRIPSWMWISGGRNRSIARDAFADQLPTEIFQRQAKGDFTGFCGAAYSRQRSALADHLLGGWLAQNGVLDRPEVEAYLKTTAPPKDLSFFRLLDMAAVEAWARVWA